MLDNLRGWRTILINALLVGLVAIGNYVTQVDWVAVVGDTWAVVIMGAINVVMRFLTKTPVGQKR